MATLAGRDVGRLTALLYDVAFSNMKGRGGRLLRNLVVRRLAAGMATSARVSYGCRLIAPEHLRMESGASITTGCVIDARGGIRIGRDSLVGFDSVLLTETHAAGGRDRVRSQGRVAQPIDIGSNVWIGCRVVVLPGVKIGDHAVVGANSTVTRDVAPGAVVAGSPARVIRQRDVVAPQ